MPSPDYYHRQAISSLNLARRTTNPETKQQFIHLASDYMTRADKVALEQLDTFIAQSNPGVTCLTRSD